jgi:hypothetical protein
VRPGRLSLRSPYFASATLELPDGEEATEKENNKHIINCMCEYNDEEGFDGYPADDELDAQRHIRLQSEETLTERAEMKESSNFEDYERVDTNFSLFKVFQRKITSDFHTDMIPPAYSNRAIPSSPTAYPGDEREETGAGLWKRKREEPDRPSRVLDSPLRRAFFSDSDGDLDYPPKKQKTTGNVLRYSHFTIPDSPTNGDFYEPRVIEDEERTSETIEGERSKPALSRSGSSFSRLFSFRPSYLPGSPSRGSDSSQLKTSK